MNIIKSILLRSVLTASILVSVPFGIVSAQTPDVTLPTIDSIFRHVPATEATTANSVTFRVTFSEAVQNVNVADFALSGTAATTATITTVTAVSQAVYDVIVAVPGEGSLALVVQTADDDIEDLAGLSYDDAVAISSGYVVNHAPSITNIVRHDPTTATVAAGEVVFRVTFSEAVTGVDKTDFLLTGTAASTSTVGTVTAVSGTVYDVAVTITADGTLTLGTATTQNITDGTNAYSGTITSQETYAVVIAPTIESIVRSVPTTEITADDEVIFRVTFSEAVTGVSKTDFELMGTAAEESTITKVVDISTSSYDVTVTTADGVLGLRPKSSASIDDVDGNDYAGAVVTSQTYTVGLPSVISIDADTKSDTQKIDDTTIEVTDDSGIQATNVTVDSSTTVTVSDFTCAQVSNTKVTCTVKIDGVGKFVIRAVDNAGNVVTSTESGYDITDDVDVNTPRYTVSKDDTEKLSKRSRNYATSKRVEFKGDNNRLKGGLVKIYDGKDKLGEVKMSTKDGTWRKSISFKKNGSYDIEFKFYDKHGDKIDTLGEYQIRVDDEAPKFDDMPTKLTKRAGQRIWWNATDNHKVKRYRYFWLGKKTKTKDGHFFVPAGTRPGVYDLELRAYDRAGNRTDKKITITVR